LNRLARSPAGGAVPPDARPAGDAKGVGARAAGFLRALHRLADIAEQLARLAASTQFLILLRRPSPSMSFAPQG
jgi:hypothetical protein